MSVDSVSFKSIVLTSAIHSYLQGQADPPGPAHRWLIERTRKLGDPAEMQIPIEQGVLLTLLAQLIGARRIVEIGTFTGYSTLCLALGTIPGGLVITCDINEEWTDIAREAWARAGVVDRVDLRIGRASETLDVLSDAEAVDMVFIDADKPGYVDYWEQLVPRVRPGGILLADNVLYSGLAADPMANGNAGAIREFNELVRADGRVSSVMLPIADGLTIARKHL